MIALIGESWGENEERLQRPFVGTSGLELAKMCDEAGIIKMSFHDRSMAQAYWSTRDPKFVAAIWDAHPELYLTNVFNIRPRPTNDIANLCGSKAQSIPGRPSLSLGKYILAKYASELNRLEKELLSLKPNLAIAVGGTAAWALLGQPGILKIRGTVAWSNLGIKCIPIVHPAAILREWKLRVITVSDLIKARRESAFREIRRPQRAVWTEPSLSDMETFYETYIRECKLLSIDIETVGTEITCIGFAPNERVSLVVPFVDLRKPDGAYWINLDHERAAWKFVSRCLRHPCRKVFQNGAFDLSILYNVYGLATAGECEDTMLLHHALQPEMQKGLGFLGSVYTNEPAWKLMRSKHMETLKRDE
ncbi:MAG TPA: uracil-DNA glycosylase family protein [Scandinavium sp.]|jgi:uracil-DNA glycosylase|uniref:uracil-DNA glycosylase family protein n=1 Tax=Scandinavium sp. TaxID=2830653 RepID=UPI002E2FA316|nr:uracil-DNA glycosylase family protein [Scandinavium sp.]HEX4500594.1 uracil-DNA glycosylase family protein [Scandinavium sp.]